MLGAKPMQAIRAQDLNALYTSLRDRLAPCTVGHVHRLLHLVFGHATKWGNIKRNIVGLVDAPKVPPTEAPVLQLTEIPQMFDAVRGRGYSLYPIALSRLARECAGGSYVRYVGKTSIWTRPRCGSSGRWNRRARAACGSRSLSRTVAGE